MNFQIISAGVAMAIAAIGAVLNLESSFATLALAWGCHLAASALLAWPALALLPLADQRDRQLAFLLLTLSNFLIPGLLILLAASIWIGRQIRLMPSKIEPELVHEPIFIKDRGEESDDSSGGIQIRSRLKNTAVAANERMAALLAIQDIPARYSADLLRGLLSDPLEDMRLLAYGMLEKKEKVISDQIIEQRARTESPMSERNQFTAYKLLAELNWELVHQTLVVGDMRNYCAKQAEENARKALAIDEADAGLWQLMGKIQLVLQQPEQAEESFESAVRHGLPRERAIPYLAECAFRTRQFDRVRSLLAQLENKSGALILANVKALWVPT